MHVDVVWSTLNARKDKKVALSFEEFQKCLIQLEFKGKLSLDTIKLIINLF
jgi:hypothetical protein